MYILAGKTAMRRAINPKIEKLLANGNSNPKPPSISKRPLRYTNNFGFEKLGGTIFKKNFGRRKCIIPVKQKIVAGIQREKFISTHG